jgi:hypothetical protein
VGKRGLGKPRLLNKEREAELCAQLALRRELTDKKLAVRFGIPEGSVSWRNRYIARKPAAKRTPAQVELLAAINLRHELSHKALCAKYGISLSALHNYRQRWRAEHG